MSFTSSRKNIARVCRCLSLSRKNLETFRPCLSLSHRSIFACVSACHEQTWAFRASPSSSRKNIGSSRLRKQLCLMSLPHIRPNISACYTQKLLNPSIPKAKYVGGDVDENDHFSYGKRVAACHEKTSKHFAGVSACHEKTSLFFRCFFVTNWEWGRWLRMRAMWRKIVISFQKKW